MIRGGSRSCSDANVVDFQGPLEITIFKLFWDCGTCRSASIPWDCHVLDAGLYGSARFLFGWPLRGQSATFDAEALSNISDVVCQVPTAENNTTDEPSVGFSEAGSASAPKLGHQKLSVFDNLKARAEPARVDDFGGYFTTKHPTMPNLSLVFATRDRAEQDVIAKFAERWETQPGRSSSSRCRAKSYMVPSSCLA